MFVLALIRVFLPVPIAFDVVVCGMLLALGLAPGYVMTLLFTLGAFSVYSYFIVAQSISTRIATALTIWIVGLGAFAGIGAQAYHDWQSDRALEILLGGSRMAPAHATGAPTISLQRVDFAPRSPAADTQFTRLEAREIGITKPLEFSFKDMWPPFWEGRSVSSGDIDRDGDIDVVVASTEVGLYIYRNDGVGNFTRDEQELGAISDMPVFNAALADLDNDGWPDLFLATYRSGNWIAYNREGRFDTRNLAPVPNVPDAILSMALSFDDINADGALDAALGNWAAGWYREVPGEESRNRVILSGTAPFGTVARDMPAIPGETLSILFSDIDNDNLPDLLVGNDFKIPDAIYRGLGQGEFSQFTFQDGLIPHTTTTTMAIKTSDLDNDGQTQIYFAQIAGRSTGVSEILKMQPIERYCDTIQFPRDKAICEKNMEIKRWYKSGNQFDPTYANKCAKLSGHYQKECKAMLVKDLAIQRRDPKVCTLIPKDQPEARNFCDIHFWSPRDILDSEKEASIPQILRSNVLLEKEGQVYVDTAGPRGLEVGGWSWDTKVFDADNDGYQDIYVVNGTWVPNEVTPSNLFFHNQGDGRFVEASGPFGLEDYLMTAAATQLDWDNDGDLDLVGHPVNGPLVAFRNNLQSGNSIAFRLSDALGNRDGIGARVEITQSDGGIQSREIQLGGGFMSFDAPIAHFGLGDETQIEAVTIRWRNGPESRIPGPLLAGGTYTISRTE